MGEENQCVKVPRNQFIEKAAERAIEKLTEQAEKLGRIAWENKVLERHYQQDEASEEALINDVIKPEQF